MKLNAHSETVALYRLTLIAAAVGLFAGGAAFVLVHLIALITNLALLQTYSWELPPSSAFTPGPAIVIAAVSGGFVVAFLAKWCPVIRGHGLPEAMEAVLTKQSKIAPRAAVAKPLSAAVAIGTGGPFGAEGPIIVTGGALGSLVGQILPVSPAQRKILLCSGAAAGMAAVFGAPLAAVVLAVELLLFEFSLRALVPLIVATSVAGGMHTLMFGAGPLFQVPEHEFFGLGVLPTFALLGVACGLIAALINKVLFLVEAGFRRLPVTEFWHPVIGAVGFATVGLFVPRALGVGYDEIGDVLNGRLAIGTVAVLLVGKLLAWWIALGSGTSGGTLAPLLLIGGCFGTLFGQLAHNYMPGQQPSVPAFALIAMAAVFGASTRLPFTSIVFLFELTQDYESVLPLMGTTVAAVLVVQGLMGESLMTEKLSRRGLFVSNFAEVDPLRVVEVAEVMSSTVESIPADASVLRARDAIVGGRHSAYPMVDRAGRLVAVISRNDLLEDRDVDPDSPAIDIASTDLVTIAPKAMTRDALGLMLSEEVEHLPVVDDDQLVGMCTRTDVLRGKASQLDQEKIDRGWVPPWRRES